MSEPAAVQLLAGRLGCKSDGFPRSRVQASPTLALVLQLLQQRQVLGGARLAHRARSRRVLFGAAADSGASEAPRSASGIAGSSQHGAAGAAAAARAAPGAGEGGDEEAAAAVRLDAWRFLTSLALFAARHGDIGLPGEAACALAAALCVVPLSFYYMYQSSYGMSGLCWRLHEATSYSI